MKRWKTVRNNRLKHWDYSSDGYYFVTINTKGRFHDFGEVIGGKMVLNRLGKITKECWEDIPKHFPFVTLDKFVIMPDHMHGIIQIDKVGPQDLAVLRYKRKKHKSRNRFGPQSQNLGSIIRGFKIGVTKYANTNNIDFIWQPRYYDRIIRGEIELEKIRKYIRDNPTSWKGK